MEEYKWVLAAIVALFMLLPLIVVENHKRYLLFLLAALIPFHVGFVFFHYNGVLFTDIPLLILLLVSLAEGNRFRVLFPRLALPMVGLLIWALLSMWPALDRGIAFSEFTRLLRAMLIFLVVANGIRTKSDLRVVLLGVFLSFMFQSLVAVVQWRIGAAGLYFLGEKILERWRSSGTMVHPVVFGAYLAFLLPLAYRFFMFYVTRDRRLTLFYIALFVLGVVALFTTRARGPWLGVFFAMGLMAVRDFRRIKFKRRNRIRAWAIFFLGMLFSMRYAYIVADRFLSVRSSKSSVNLRMPLNYVGVQVIADKPLLGVGLGNYLLQPHSYLAPFVDKAYARWSNVYRGHLFQTVHNAYLMMAVEMGIPALVFWLWIVFVLYKMGFRSLRVKDAIVMNVSVGILTGYTGVFVAFLTSPDYRVHQILNTFWFLGGILVAMHSMVGREMRRRRMAARHAGDSPNGDGNELNQPEPRRAY